MSVDFFQTRDALLIKAVGFLPSAMLYFFLYILLSLALIF